VLGEPVALSAKEVHRLHREGLAGLRHTEVIAVVFSIRGRPDRYQVPDGDNLVQLVAQLQDAGDEPQDSDVAVRSRRQPGRRTMIDEAAGDEISDGLEVKRREGVKDGACGALAVLARPPDD